MSKIQHGNKKERGVEGNTKATFQETFGLDDDLLACTLALNEGKANRHRTNTMISYKCFSSLKSVGALPFLGPSLDVITIFLNPIGSVNSNTRTVTSKYGGECQNI